MVVDFCKSASVMEHEDGTPTEFDDVNCQTSGQIPPFNEYLNVNTPLQIGGMAAERFDPLQFKWSHTPLGKPFNGCIRDAVVQCGRDDNSDTKFTLRHVLTKN